MFSSEGLISMGAKYWRTIGPLGGADVDTSVVMALRKLRGGLCYSNQRHFPHI